MSCDDRDVLPKTVKPLHYDLFLYDLEIGGAWSYKGTVKMQLRVLESASQITLNALDLEIQSACLEAGDYVEKATGIHHDHDAQRATLAFSRAFPSGREGVLEIAFVGTMNNLMAGFYRSRYRPTTPTVAPTFDTESGKEAYMFSTHFESSGARRAFPCFDEPNLKATFDVHITIPEDLVALSNMPEKEVSAASHGRKTVSFATTPIMSTYLLAWALGDFEYVEAFTQRHYYGGKPLPVRVYTTRGLSGHGRFALEQARRAIDYFSAAFGIDYPLPKADLLACHEFVIGAMENWGLVTYRATALLFHAGQSGEARKQRIAYVVAHELAHQWFGNLVTMDWWDELWLKESFATFVGWCAVDHLFPDWQVWATFVAQDMRAALELDALRASHPIAVPVRHAADVDQIFDAISYEKGSAVIRMLSAFLGRDTFFAGVSAYLKSHAYGNATTRDLWAACSAASGQDVAALMDPWIRKVGFPVLSLTEDRDQIEIRQARYLSSGDAQPDEDETRWWIPLGFKTEAAAAAAKPGSEADDDDDDDDVIQTMTGRREIIRHASTAAGYKLNGDATGFFRTVYPPARLARLGASRGFLSAEDRIGLVGDAAALAMSGDATTVGLLSLCAAWKDEDNTLVWSSLLHALTHVQLVFSSKPTVTAGLQEYLLALVAPAAERAGWDFPAGESFLAIQRRTLLIGAAVRAGHEKYCARAQSSYEAYLRGDKSAVNPNLLGAVVAHAVRTGGRDAYDAVKALFASSTAADTRVRLLDALCRAQDPLLIADLLEFALAPAESHVAVQDVHYVAAGLAANPAAREVQWEWVKRHWEAVVGKVGGNSMVANRFVQSAIGSFASAAMEADVRGFFEGRETKGFERGVRQKLDVIRANAAWRVRDEELVAGWLGVEGYGA